MAALTIQKWDQGKKFFLRQLLKRRFLHKIFYKRATIQGILARDYYARYPEMLRQMSQWIRENKLKFQETHFQGFESLPKALNSLFYGDNTGKIVVDV
jgi:NADPH-dependent curcumin reductase CurA